MISIITDYYVFRCIVAIVAYFVTGILIMKFYKKASGTDVIPNKGFWIFTLLLIKVHIIAICVIVGQDFFYHGAQSMSQWCIIGPVLNPCLSGV